ncbi:MAG: rRNA maturation RNase YbeY [Spartobacteria bacterium]
MKTPILPSVRVHNRQRKLVLDRAALERFAQRALPFCMRQEGTGLTTLPEIDVLLISDHRMAELHQRFMQIPGPTDVITFQHGEIFISAETAQRQADEYGATLEQELRLYLVHGLLHLHGFDDREPGARGRMGSTQEKIVALASV